MSKTVILDNSDLLKTMNLVQSEDIGGNKTDALTCITEVKLGQANTIDISHDHSLSLAKATYIGVRIYDMHIANNTLHNSLYNSHKIKPEYIKSVCDTSTGIFEIITLDLKDYSDVMNSRSYYPRLIAKMNYEELISLVEAYDAAMMSFDKNWASILTALTLKDAVIKVLNHVWFIPLEVQKRSFSNPDIIKEYGMHTLEDKLNHILKYEHNFLRFLMKSEEDLTEISQSLSLNGDILKRYQFSEQMVLRLANNPQAMIDVLMDENLKLHLNVDENLSQILSEVPASKRLHQDIIPKVVIGTYQQMTARDYKALSALGGGNYKLNVLVEDYKELVRSSYVDGMGLIKMADHYGANTDTFDNFFKQWITIKSCRALSVERNLPNDTSRFLATIKGLVSEGKITEEADLLKVIGKFYNERTMKTFIKQSIAIGMKNSDNNAIALSQHLTAVNRTDLAPSEQTIEHIRQKLENMINSDAFNQLPEAKRDEIQKLYNQKLDQVEENLNSPNYVVDRDKENDVSVLFNPFVQSLSINKLDNMNEINNQQYLAEQVKRIKRKERLKNRELGNSL